MDSTEASAASPIDSEEGGILLGEGGGITAAEMYDPATGNAALIPGYPISRTPPTPDQTRMGLIDSGVIPDHPQLRNLIVEMKDFTGDDPIDRNGHGTTVAILLSGNKEDGYAIVSAKVTDAAGKIDVEHVIEAIHWLATQNVRVVNISLGFLGKAERYTKLCEAMAQYEKEPNGGIMFVAAAGNFGPNVSVYPAACTAPNLIRVEAVVDGKLWAKSGKGDIAADGSVQFLSPYGYHLQKADKLARDGAYDRAREEYKASIASEPNAGALYGIGLLDIRDGNLDSAYTALLQARDLAPNIGITEGQLGRVRLMQKRWADAIPHLDRAIELDPKDVTALTNRALALIRLGKQGAALSDLMEARALAWDDPNIKGLMAEAFGGLEQQIPPQS
jgi:tetratricopeptide (TPR) repeat protein